MSPLNVFCYNGLPQRAQQAHRAALPRPILGAPVPGCGAVGRERFLKGGSCLFPLPDLTERLPQLAPPLHAGTVDVRGLAVPLGGLRPLATPRPKIAEPQVWFSVAEPWVDAEGLFHQ